MCPLFRISDPVDCQLGFIEILDEIDSILSVLTTMFR